MDAATQWLFASPESRSRNARAWSCVVLHQPQWNLARMHRDAPPDDIVFQEKTWRVQRFGWLAVSAVLAAAVSGVFGVGPLANAEVRQGGVLIVYERIQRAGRESMIVLASGRQAPVRVRLAGSAIRNADILNIAHPQIVAATGEAVVLLLPPGEHGDSAGLQLRMRSPGWFSASIGQEGEPEQTMHILVMP